MSQLSHAATTSDRICKILVEILGSEIADRITPEARFAEDLHADSLDGVEISTMVEEEFYLQAIDDAELDKVATVGDLIALVDRKLAGGRS